MPCCSFEVDKELSHDFLKQFHDVRENCVEELYGGKFNIILYYWKKYLILTYLKISLII